MIKEIFVISLAHLLSLFKLFGDARVLSGFLLLFCFSGLQAQQATGLPFETDFEAGEGYTVGPLSSDSVWGIGNGLNASIVTPGASSSQALNFIGTDPLSISFVSSGSSISWVDYYLRPEFVDSSELTTVFDPTRPTATGFVASGSQGEVFAVDGDGLGGGIWLGSGLDHQLDADFAADWIRLTYRLNYSSKNWDLFIDSKLVLADLGFLDDSFASLGGFYFDANNTVATQLDYFYAGDENPLFTDSANDGLPDAWLLANGLSVGINQRGGDPDGDGLSNLQEYMLSTDPLSADTDGDGVSDATELAIGTNPNNSDSDGDGLSDGDELALGKDPLVDDVDGLHGYVRRDLWYGLAGFGVKPLTNLALFPKVPHQSQLISLLDFPQPESSVNHYGQRVYGWLIAPETASYVFSMASSGKSELWLSSDASPSNRALIIDQSAVSDYLEWNLASKPVHLEAGDTYFFEFLYRHRLGDDFCTVGWSFAGNPIVPIGSDVLQINIPELDDADMDGFSDQWELANGLDPLKGYGKNGYNGDLDNDGIPNYQERSYGTRPDKADTDGDGYNDGMEIETLYSDPTVADFDRSQSAVVSTVSGSDYVAYRGLWQQEGDVAYSVDATGSLTYDLNFATAGAFKLVIDFSEHNASKSGSSSFTVEALVNGHSIGQMSNFASYGPTREFVFYLPFLEVGTHSLELVWVNGLEIADSSMEVQSLRLESFGGTDSDSSGVADWIESRALHYGDETTPTHVYVSPFFVEGQSFAPEYVSVRSHVDGLPEVVRDEVVQKGLQYHYYADVPMVPGETRILEIVDQFGLRSVQYPITWEAFNLYEHEFIHIRKDGSLLIEVVDPQATVAQGLTLEIHAPDGSSESHSLPAGGSLQALFDHAGDWLLTTSIPQAVGEEPLVLNATVQVSAASLTPAPILLNQNQRTWIPTLSDGEIEMQSDVGLQLVEFDPSASPRSFQLSTAFDGARIVARLPNGGPILDVTEATVIKDYSRSQTYNNVVETFADGSVLVSAYIYLSEVPEDLSIDIQVWKSGVTFEDGTIWRTITAEDFDEQGRYRFYMLRSPGVSGGNCHRYWIEQDGQNIGQL